MAEVFKRRERNGRGAQGRSDRGKLYFSAGTVATSNGPSQANALATNWGSTIFQSANEMVNNDIIRQRVADIQAKGKEDAAMWEEERKNIRSKFMEELEEEAPVKSPKTAVAPTGGSDEDAVLVEGGGPAASGSTGTSKGGAKKRKGKK